MPALTFSCPRCGSSLDMGAAQCPGCGVRINTAAYAAATAQANTAAPAPAPASAASAPTPASTAPAAPAPAAPAAQTPASTASSATNASASAPSDDLGKALNDATKQAAVQFNHVMSSKEVAQAKAKANHFFAWVLNSWKHPTQKLSVPKWYGAISFVLQSAIISLMYLISSNGFMSQQRSYGAALSQRYSSRVPNQVFDLAGSMVVDVVVKLLIVTLVCEFIFIAFTYLGYRLTHSAQLGLLEFITRVAQYSNINLLFVCIAFVFNILSLGIISAILLMFTGPILFIAAVVAMAEEPDQSGKDVMHAAFLPIIGAGVSGLVYCILLVGIVIAAMGDVFASLAHALYL